MGTKCMCTVEKKTPKSMQNFLKNRPIKNAHPVYQYIGSDPPGFISPKLRNTLIFFNRILHKLHTFLGDCQNIGKFHSGLVALLSTDSCTHFI